MEGNNKYLMERDVNKVEPLRFKILVEVLPEKPKSELLHMPDTLNNGDTTRKAFWARVVKVGNMVKGTKPGLMVAMDPSLDTMSMLRCFRWDGKHYMLCDVSDIIMVDFEGDNNETDVEGKSDQAKAEAVTT